MRTKRVKKLDFKKIQKRKEALLLGLTVPKEALPGSLSVSSVRCGKKNCHCSAGQRHEAWTLTYMSGGKKYVQHIPQHLVEYARQRVSEGRSFRETVNEILAANAQLLALREKEKAGN